MPKSLSRILFVEDDSDIQTIAKISLEAFGNITVEICCSGEEAIRKASEFHPDLLLLDVMMPGMDGEQTLKALREIGETASIPAIFMTAKVHPDEVARYKRLGVVDVIFKPFNPLTLFETVHALWKKHTLD